MNFIDFFSGLFQITFAVFAGLLIAFKLAWPKIEGFGLKMHALSKNKDLQKENLQLKVNAYERLLILSNRMEPRQLLLRNAAGHNSARQLNQVLLAELEQKFQHNFSQQLYVSDVAWATVRDLKENTSKLLNNILKVGGNDDSADNYMARILQFMEQAEEKPYELAQKTLKRELSN